MRLLYKMHKTLSYYFVFIFYPAFSPGMIRKKDTHAVAPIPERLRKNEKVIIITADNTEDIESLSRVKFPAACGVA